MTRKVLFSFGVALMAALSAGAPSLAQQHEESNNRVVLEQIVARVNNQIITLSDLEVARLRQEQPGVRRDRCVNQE